MRRARGRATLVAVVAACAAGLGVSARAAAKPPAITARSAILVEASSGEVLYARAPRRRRAIASTTKLMTALLVLELDSLRDTFSAVDYHALPAESTIHLQPGERMRVADLLVALLLPSANDAAETLAVRTVGSKAAFVREMNARASELGLTGTHYANPIGLDAPGNYSTAQDLVTLARRLRHNRFFARTVDRPAARLRSGRRPRVVVNRNDLVREHPFVNGVKTGHTLDAGYVLVGSATRRGVTVLSAVLGDPSEATRDADSLALLRYGLSQLRAVRVFRAGQVVGSARIRHKGDDRVDLVAAEALTRALRRGQRPTVRVSAPGSLEGPLPAGASVGTAQVLVDGRVVARVPVLTAARVPRVGVFERVLRFLVAPATLAVMLMAGAALVVIRRRRGRRRRTQGKVEPA